MDHASRTWVPDCSELTIKRKNDYDVFICRHDVIVKVFDIVVFLLSNLVTDPSFMSIPLWNFLKIFVNTIMKSYENFCLLPSENFVKYLETGAI